MKLMKLIAMCLLLAVSKFTMALPVQYYGEGAFWVSNIESYEYSISATFDDHLYGDMLTEPTYQ